MLPIWKVLADTVIPEEDKKYKYIADGPKGKDHARVVRLKLDSGEPIIGLSLQSEDVPKVGPLSDQLAAFRSRPHTHAQPQYPRLTACCIHVCSHRQFCQFTAEV